MAKKYSYNWYIRQFEEAKNKAEQFILSVDETFFLHPPAEGKWSIAECYSHLINYGNLYFDNLAAGIANAQIITNDLDQSFKPRWIARQLVSLFEPPYKLKFKTFRGMQPGPVVNFDRLVILDEYVNLQDRFISRLEKGRHRHVDLGATKIRHPMWSFIKMTISECLALAEAHQRRHQWQAEQTLGVLKKRHAADIT